MNGLYITTTELRTKSAQLVNLLAAGADINLIHRSKIVGVIEPKKDIPGLLTKKDIYRLKGILRHLEPENKLSRPQRLKIYRQHLEDRYVKRIS